MDFHTRHHASELMDDPDCDEAALFRTLDQFGPINRWFSRTRTLLTRTVLADMSPGREYHLVDLGAGGCDIPVWLLGEATLRGLSLKVTAVDADPRIVRYATERHREISGLRILEADALDLDALAPFDYLTGNHFLHHLPDEAVHTLLRDASRLAGRGFLFTDLLRSRWSYTGFSLFARIFRNSFTREDGLLSIRRGFRPEDFRALESEPALRVFRMCPGRINLLGGDLTLSGRNG